MQSAADVLGVRLLVLYASTESEVTAAFATLIEQHAGALVIGSNLLSPAGFDQIISHAGRYAIPTLFFDRDQVVGGGLASYGTRLDEALRQVGVYTSRILKMLWGGSGENISIAALSKPMEPRYDESQSQDCERPQPVSRPAGYGRDGDRGDRRSSVIMQTFLRG